MSAPASRLCAGVEKDQKTRLHRACPGVRHQDMRQTASTPKRLHTLRRTLSSAALLCGVAVLVGAIYFFIVGNVTVGVLASIAGVALLSGARDVERFASRFADPS